MNKKKYKADGTLRPHRVRRAEKRKNQLDQMPISRLINSLEGEAKVVETDWVQDDTTLEQDFALHVAAQYMKLAAYHLRRARFLGSM